ncbi:hypothetical protein CMI37_37780 [Candidatus Pacearchaeota archaeon]|nr:hypothetical protein [Candidatus Pacearchaeota archaeon]
MKPPRGTQIWYTEGRDVPPVYFGLDRGVFREGIGFPNIEPPVARWRSWIVDNLLRRALRLLDPSRIIE